MFNPGDSVRCTYGYDTVGPLVENEIYLVSDMSGDKMSVRLQGALFKHGFWQRERFELVMPEEIKSYSDYLDSITGGKDENT